MKPNRSQIRSKPFLILWQKFLRWLTFCINQVYLTISGGGPTSIKTKKIYVFIHWNGGKLKFIFGIFYFKSSQQQYHLEVLLPVDNSIISI